MSQQRARRAVAEVRWDKDPGTVVWVAERPLHHYWPMLSAYFRDILLAPHRRAEEAAVSWSWQEPANAEAISPGELSTVRKRLRRDEEMFADALARDQAQARGDRSALHGHASLDELSAGMGAVLEQLAARSDAELAAFVCRTESGLRVHSWGARTAARPTYPDSEAGAIAGQVRVRGQPRRGVVCLRTVAGHEVARVRTERDGSFRFADLAPGEYRVTAEARGAIFAPAGVGVTVSRGPVEGILIEDTSPPRAVPPRWRWVAVLALLVAGGAAAWRWSGSRHTAEVPPGATTRGDEAAPPAVASAKAPRAETAATGRPAARARVVLAEGVGAQGGLGGGGVMRGGDSRPDGTLSGQGERSAAAVGSAASSNGPGRVALEQERELIVPGSPPGAPTAATGMPLAPPAGPGHAPGGGGAHPGAGGVAAGGPVSGGPASASAPATPAPHEPADDGAATKPLRQPSSTPRRARAAAADDDVDHPARPATRPETPRPPGEATEIVAAEASGLMAAAAVQDALPVISSEEPPKAATLPVSSPDAAEVPPDAESKAVAKPARPGRTSSATAVGERPADAPSSSATATADERGQGGTPRPTAPGRTVPATAARPDRWHARAWQVRLEPWEPRVLADVILPTVPVRRGAADTVPTARARAVAELAGRMPIEFSRPQLRHGLRFERSRGANPRSGWRWQAMTAAPSTGGRSGEAVSTGETEASFALEHAGTWRLVSDEGGCLAEVVVAAGARSYVVRTADGIAVCPWSEHAGTPDNRFAWRTPAGTAAGRIDARRIAGPPWVGLAGEWQVSLFDPWTGWGLVGRASAKAEE